MIKGYLLARHDQKSRHLCQTYSGETTLTRVRTPKPVAPLGV
jgi:hypothetical protein